MARTRAQAEIELARSVRETCVAEFQRAWEDAAVQGLCGEGALEYALDHLRRMDPQTLLDGPPD